MYDMWSWHVQRTFLSVVTVINIYKYLQYFQRNYYTCITIYIFHAFVFIFMNLRFDSVKVTTKLCFSCFGHQFNDFNVCHWGKCGQHLNVRLETQTGEMFLHYKFPLLFANLSSWWNNLHVELVDIHDKKYGKKERKSGLSVFFPPYFLPFWINTTILTKQI